MSRAARSPTLAARFSAMASPSPRRSPSPARAAASPTSRRRSPSPRRRIRTGSPLSPRRPVAWEIPTTVEERARSAGSPRKRAPLAKTAFLRRTDPHATRKPLARARAKSPAKARVKGATRDAASLRKFLNDQRVSPGPEGRLFFSGADRPRS